MPDTPPSDAPTLSTTELCDALEALLFAAKAPLKKVALRASIKRFVTDHEGEPAEETPAPATCGDADAPVADAAGATAPTPTDATASKSDAADAASFALSSPEPSVPSIARRFDEAFAALKDRWAPRERGGFGLTAVADGWAFRSHARFGPLLRSEREGRPTRLSKPALEALAIVAYQQPVTKPEIDHLRGVDSGAGLRVLLERQLIEITGKKDEPGRPLLYATTAQFLDFFALAKIGDLPSLRQYQELHEDHLEQSRAAGLTDLAALAAEAPKLSASDPAAAEALVAAMDSLGQARAQARDAFAQHGIHVGDGDGPSGPEAETPATMH